MDIQIEKTTDQKGHSIYKVQVDGEFVALVYEKASSSTSSPVKISWVCPPGRVSDLVIPVTNALNAEFKAAFFKDAESTNLDLDSINATYELKMKTACSKGLCFVPKNGNPDMFAATDRPDVPLNRKTIILEYGEVEFINDRYPEIQGPKDSAELKAIREACAKGLVWSGASLMGEFAASTIPDTLENRKAVREQASEPIWFANDYFIDLLLN